MNLTQEKSLFHLTGKLRLSQVGHNALQKLADESPYFAPARFLLTADLKQNGSEWISHARKTNLYFTNPNWLQYQLENIIQEPATGKLTPALGPEPIITRDLAEMAVPSLQSFKETMRSIDPVATSSDVPEASRGTENIVTIGEENAGTSGPADASSENSLTRHEPEAMDDTDEPVPDEYVEESDAIIETPAADSKIADILSSQLADFKKPVEPDAVLDIDADKKPLHTIDYFVSQGIRVDLSAMPQDKLTTHLRKFTDWLKQVKTSGNNPQDLGTNLEMEKAVVETAKNSNETREVVTESMADVLEKQGQTDKAIQLYIKLSFLNPEKSSYFAAKIEQLKGI